MLLPHHQEHHDQHAEDQRRFDAEARQAGCHARRCLVRAESALDVAEALFEKRLAPGHLHVLDRAEALLQQVQLLLIQVALRLADALPRSPRHHDRHQHDAQHDRDGDERDRRRRCHQHERERKDDHAFGKDVHGRTREQLVRNVRGARHRLDQRCRSALGVKQVFRREIASRAGVPRPPPTIDRRCPAQPFRPRQEHARADVKRADAERQQPRRAREARSATSPIDRDTTGAVRTCSGSTTSRSSPNTASAPAASITAAIAATGTSSEPSPALARRQPADYRA